MVNKKRIQIISIILSILVGGALIGFGVFGDFSERENSSLQGALMGLGAGLIGAAGAQLVSIRIYTKNPELMDKKVIEVKDERNITIKNKAKSKVYDIYNLVFPIMIFGLIIANVDFTLIGIMLVIYAFRIILLIAYTNKYNREM